LNSSVVERYEISLVVDGVSFMCIYKHELGERLLTVTAKLSTRRLKKACEAMCKSQYVSSAEIKDGKLICSLQSSADKLTSKLAFEPVLKPIADVANTNGNRICRSIRADTSQKRYGIRSKLSSSTHPTRVSQEERPRIFVPTVHVPLVR